MRLLVLNVLIIPAISVALVAVALTNDRSTLLAAAVVLAAIYAFVVKVLTLATWPEFAIRLTSGLIGIAIASWFIGFLIAPSL